MIFLAAPSALFTTAEMALSFPRVEICVSCSLALHILYKQPHLKVALFSLNTNDDFCPVRMENESLYALPNDFSIEASFTVTLPFN